MGRFLRKIIIAGALLATGAGLFFPSISHAAGDNTLSSSNPAPSEVVSVAPTQLQLVFVNPFTNPKDIEQMGISLVCNGNIVNLGAAQLGADVKTVSTPLTQVPSAGTCTVSWALPDGSSGAYNFTSAIALPTTSTSSIPGGETPITVVPGTESTVSNSSWPRVGGPLGLFRTLSYVLIGTLFGSFALILLAWPEGVEYQVCKRFLRITWIFAALVTFAVLVFTTAQITGKGVTSSLSPNAWRELAESLPGWGILLRCILVGVVGLVAWNPERILDPGTQAISVASLVFMCLVFGLNRTGGRIEVLGHVNAGVHMLAVSMWFGGLVLLVRVVLIGSGDSDLVQAVRGFSRLAPRAIAVVVFTGIVSTYRYDGFALLSNSHGRILLLKIAAVGFMTYAMFTSRFFIGTRLARASTLEMRPAAHLRRAVGSQAAAGVVVLGLTAWMMSTTPIYFDTKPATGGPVYASVQDLRNDRFHVRFSVSPATVGPNQVLIELFEPQRIQEFTIRMTPKADGYDGYLIRVPLTRRGAALLGANGEFPLKAPGDWTIEINGTSTTGDLAPLAATLTIGDPATTTTVASSSTLAGATTSSSAPVAPVAPVTTVTTTTTTALAPAG
jgi:putative copper export protein/methionine-rich copper-binding protein CopC